MNLDHRNVTFSLIPSFFVRAARSSPLLQHESGQRPKLRKGECGAVTWLAPPHRYPLCVSYLNHDSLTAHPQARAERWSCRKRECGPCVSLWSAHTSCQSADTQPHEWPAQARYSFPIWLPCQSPLSGWLPCLTDILHVFLFCLTYSILFVLHVSLCCVFPFQRKRAKAVTHGPRVVSKVAATDI